MKNLFPAVLAIFVVLRTGLAFAQGTVSDLKAYMAQREEIKALELPAVKTIAANSGEKLSRRGLAEYYIFLKSPAANDPAAGAKLVDALVKAGDAYMDPITFTKLALMYAHDYPAFGVKKDLAKCLFYLSASWEFADLSDKATGDNALLTLVVNNTLGLGDGLLGSPTDRAALNKTLDAIRPDVMKARARFKKLYNLSVKDEYPNSTNLERHYQ